MRKKSRVEVLLFKKNFLALFVLFCLFFGVSCNTSKEKGAASKMTESGLQEEDELNACSQTSYSLEGNKIVMEGDCLYYNDPEREGAMYAYNMQTKKEICISKLHGEVYRTTHGLFYLSENEVYKIVASEIVKLCELPGDGEFIDLYQDKVVWAKWNKVQKSSYEYVLKQSICLQNVTEGENVVSVSEPTSKKIYDISGTDDCINDVLFVEDELYIAQESGLYCLNYSTMELRCVFENDIMMLCSDKEDILFKGIDVSVQDKYSLYTFNKKTKIVQKINSTYEPDFAMIKDGMVYYNDGGVMLYDISENEYNILSNDSIYSNQAYTEVAVYNEYIILRHGYGYYFVILNRNCNEIKKLDGTGFYM